MVPHAVQFLAGVLRWDGDDLDPMHSGIALEPLEEYPPTCIMDRLGQLAVAYHVLDLKVFIGNQVVRRDIRVCHLAGKILTLPLNLQMLLGKCFSGLFPVSRFLLFTRESPLQTCKLLLSFAIVSGVGNGLTFRVSQVGFESYIYAQLFTGWDMLNLTFGIDTELAIVSICASTMRTRLIRLMGNSWIR